MCAVIDEVNAIAFSEQIERPTGSQYPTKTLNEPQVLFLNASNLIPFMGRNTVGTIADDQVDGLVWYFVTKLQRITAQYLVFVFVIHLMRFLSAFFNAFSSSDSM